MEWADVFLHPSISEGFGVVVLEAQSMALPVVCTDADGLKENVVDGVTGFVVLRRNPQALAEKLKTLMRDSALRLQMGYAGRNRVVTSFRVEDQISAWEQFFQSIERLGSERNVAERPLSTAKL
jgi:colanic acid/amylovoran biosynthesis glycosyltransferase